MTVENDTKVFYACPGTFAAGGDCKVRPGDADGFLVAAGPAVAGRDRVEGKRQMSMNYRLKRWTLEEDERLKSMILAGCPPGDIAFKLNRSISAVYSRAHHLHLSFKRADTKMATGPEAGRP